MGPARGRWFAGLSGRGRRGADRGGGGARAVHPIQPVATADEALEVFPHALPVLGDLDGTYRPGEPDREGAQLALASLTRAAALTVAGKTSAIVTGPIAKARLAEVGFDHPGQTEFVAAAAGVAARMR
jgi:4-hydroxythreonine-4-phosphate dehydrogenase